MSRIDRRALLLGLAGAILTGPASAQRAPAPSPLIGRRVALEFTVVRSFRDETGSLRSIALQVRYAFDIGTDAINERFRAFVQGGRFIEVGSHSMRHEARGPGLWVADGGASIRAQGPALVRNGPFVNHVWQAITITPSAEGCGFAVRPGAPPRGGDGGGGGGGGGSGPGGGRRAPLMARQMRAARPCLAGGSPSRSVDLSSVCALNLLNRPGFAGESNSFRPKFVMCNTSKNRYLRLSLIRT